MAIHDAGMFTAKEINRLKILQDVIDRSLRPGQAAEILHERARDGTIELRANGTSLPFIAYDCLGERVVPCINFAATDDRQQARRRLRGIAADAASVSQSGSLTGRAVSAPGSPNGQNPQNSLEKATAQD